MKRMELIANRSVEWELVEGLEAIIPDFFYTRNKKNKKLLSRILRNIRRNYYETHGTNRQSFSGTGNH